MKSLRLVLGFTALLATCLVLTITLAEQPAVLAPTLQLPRPGESASATGADPTTASQPAGSTAGPGHGTRDARDGSKFPEGLIARGHYLVFRTGLCIDCHSPRDEKGAHIEAQHLMGASIPFAPTVPMPWMPAAPRLAGLPAGFNEEQLLHFLMTGERPDGRGQPLPPMPPYRFDRADAAAIVAYLKSLPSQ